MRKLKNRRERQIYLLCRFRQGQRYPHAERGKCLQQAFGKYRHFFFRKVLAVSSYTNQKKLFPFSGQLLHEKKKIKNHFRVQRANLYQKWIVAFQEQSGDSKKLLSVIIRHIALSCLISSIDEIKIHFIIKNKILLVDEYLMLLILVSLTYSERSECKYEL